MTTETFNTMSNSELTEYINESMSRKDLLLALAEEAAELSQAALKLARAEKLVNHPTPISKDQALKDLEEEYVDILLCSRVLDLEVNQELLRKKALRWAKRLAIQEATVSVEKGDPEE